MEDGDFLGPFRRGEAMLALRDELHREASDAPGAATD
jgi:hypothetical protein